MNVKLNSFASFSLLLAALWKINLIKCQMLLLEIATKK